MSVPSRIQAVIPSLHQSSYMGSLTLRALIRTASGNGGESNTETKATTRAWPEGLQMLRLFKSFLFMQRSMRMRKITDEAMEVHYELRLLDRPQTTLNYCHNHPGVNKARELRHLQCWSSN